MTAIAYRDGILATDRQVSWGDSTSATKKIHFVRVAGMGPCIVTLSGYVWGEEKILDQLKEFTEGTGQDIGEMARQSCYGFLITKNLQVHRIYGDGRVGLPELPEVPYFAEGSAHSFLLGAMSYGATAEEAVKLACQHCNYCGHGVDVLDVKAYLSEVHV